MLAGYFAVMLAVGLYYSRKHTGSESFLLADRDLGTIHVAGSCFSTFAGAGLAFASASFGYRYGVSALVLITAALIGLIIFLKLAPRIKDRSEVNDSITLPQLFEQKWDRKTRLLAILIIVALFSASLTLQLMIAGNIANQVFGFPLKASAIGFGVLVVIYTLLGGFKGVTVSDVIQMFIVFAGMVLVFLPIALLDHWQDLMSLPSSHTSEVSMPASLFLGYILIGTFAYYGSQDLFQRVYASRDRQKARKGVMIFGAVLLMITTASIVLGMVARALSETVSPDQALPFLAGEIVPLGFAGLVLAAFVSMANSTADGMLLTISSNIVEDLVKSRREITKRMELLLNRVLVVMIGSSALVFAVLLPDIAQLFNSIGSWFGILGVNVFASLYWDLEADPVFYSLLLGFGSANLIALAMGNFQASGLVGIVTSLVVLGLFGLKKRLLEA